MLNISDYDKPAFIANQKLELKKKLRLQNNKAMIVRAQTPEILPTKADLITLRINDDTPQDIAEKQTKSNVIRQQIRKVIKNSVEDKLDWKPTPIKSNVTQQMIDDYRAEQLQPVKVIDPTTGREVVYRYHPSSVDLTEIQPNLEQVLTDSDIKQMTRDKLALANEYRQIGIDLKNFYPNERQKIIDKFNVDGAKAGPDYDAMHYIELQDRADIATTLEQLNAVSKELKFIPTARTIETKRKQILKEIERQATTTHPIGAFTNNMAQLEIDIADAINKQKDIKIEIDRIDLDFQENERRNKANEISIQSTDKQNQEKLKEATEQLQILNAGKATPERLPGETDTDFRARLIAVGEDVLDDAEVERNAGELQIVRAKYNLKDFLSDASKIETIVNKLTNDERTLLNKSIVAIKKKYLDTYGFNNKNMNTDDIVSFIQQNAIVAPQQAPVQAPAQAPMTPVFTPISPPPAPFVADGDPYALSSFDKGQLVNLVDTHNLQRGTKEFMYNELLRRDLIPRKGNVVQGPYFPSPPDASPIIYPTVPTTQPRFGATLPAITVGPTTGTGIGVKLNKLPKVVKLGHIHINPSNLYYENILSVRNMNNKPFRAYRDERVSDYLASLLIKLVEGGTITKNEITALDEKEKMIYDNLIKRSKLHKQHYHNFDETAKKMKARLEILEGEVHSGNNNPLLREEIHGILFKLAHAKVITPKASQAYWKELNEIYYK